MVVYYMMTSVALWYWNNGFAIGYVLGYKQGAHDALKTTKS